ncbi:MAG TPA: efflux RND transporter permease subunit [Phycisphaerae bacterium]|nr:efflux RND transporter permease subunit [Phycisphaerae bacterium]
MNRLIEQAVKQPITVAVGVILAVLAGLLAGSRVPIQMTPTVDSVVVSVSTFWENASAAEIESDVIEEQEERLSELTGLVSMTSVSQAGSGSIRLEFRTGTDIRQAVAEVDQKLGEVPGYPVGVDEPVIEDVDPESIDYIAWIGLSSSDPNFDATTLYDFINRRVKPRFERIPGVSEVGIRGAREAEVQIRVDPAALAQRGITYAALINAIEVTNENFSGGLLPDGKSDIRVRAVGRFHDPERVGEMVIRRDAAGPVYLRDVAEIVPTYKEMTEWVRARGVLMPFINFQLAHGANLLETMSAIQDEVRAMNSKGGLLEQEAKRLGINGEFELVQTYDASSYVNDAISLVQNNIYVGGTLAVITLLLFLRSLRTIGIIAIAIPISVIASLAILVGLGRSLNIISLAGIAFATGMVVDNAIVVIENIFRHLEMGKSVRAATIEATREVAGAVVASTATTLVVFLPILLIEETAGQLFRDIALAIMAAVGLSMIVSITVVPSAASLLLRRPKMVDEPTEITSHGFWSRLRRGFRKVVDLPAHIGNLINWLNETWLRRIATITIFTAGTFAGIAMLMPPMDYLPRGNRNIVFGVLIPPPGYNVAQLSKIGDRLEEKIRPVWEVTKQKFKAESFANSNGHPGEDRRQPIKLADGSEIIPPGLDHYFLVAWGGSVFHAGIAEDSSRIIDTVDLLNSAVAGQTAPDVIGLTFQFPLFRNGGQSGSAIKIDMIGDDLEKVNASAMSLMLALMGEFGPGTVRPEPANFMLPTPELRVTPNDERLRDLGMSRRDVGYAVAVNGDGWILPRQFQYGSELKDLKIISPSAIEANPIEAMINAPIATPEGNTVDLESLADVQYIREPARVKHVSRQRAVTLQFTPPAELALQSAVEKVAATVGQLRQANKIDPSVVVNQAGTAGNLAAIRKALLGDGTIVGALSSSLFLALFVVYLLMVVLFQSWTYPVVIMVSVPLATLGGFIGLALVHHWSLADRYMPVQNMDVLTILGFVILAGVVVNNAILIVHQTLNLLNGELEVGAQRLSRKEAIAEAVRSRVRPILMSTLTSVGGMLPLVLMPGSGSELYRGLGAVVVGGLAVSTVFTLLLVPVVLSVVFDVSEYANAYLRSSEHHAEAIQASS